MLRLLEPLVRDRRLLKLLLRVADDLVLIATRLNLLLQIRGDLAELAGELLIGDVDLLRDDVVTAEARATASRWRRRRRLPAVGSR